MALRPTALHLCSGYGGFELALRPWNVRTVAHAERDSYAAAVLMERMEEARLDQAPVWDDLTTFDGAAWRGRVDIVTAGFPCQPFSAAGAKRGLDDDRWLWPQIATIIRDVRPSFVILENVPPVIRNGLPEVLHDLAQLGFDAEWGMLAAADVGAPHRRERWWCVAHADSVRREHPSEHLARSAGTPVASRRPERDTPNLVGVIGEGSAVADAGSERRQQDTGSSLGDERTDGWQPDSDHLAERNNEAVADTASSRWAQDRLYDTGNSSQTSSSGSSGNVDGGGSDVADTTGDGVATIFGAGDSGAKPEGSSDRARPAGPDPVADTESVGSLPGQRPPTRGGWLIAEAGHRFPPTRDNRNGWQEWVTAGGPQPVLRRESDGPPLGLADALHLGGNGLVPQAATEAVRQLLARAGWELK